MASHSNNACHNTHFKVVFIARDIIQEETTWDLSSKK